MPYEIFWNGDVFHKPFTGVLTPSDLLHSADKTHGDSRFDGLRYAINDFSGVSEFQLTPATFEEWSAKTFGSSFTNRRINVIFVTADESIQKAISDIIGLAEGHYTVHVFSSLEAAKEWIRLDRLTPHK